MKADLGREAKNKASHSLHQQTIPASRAEILDQREGKRRSSGLIIIIIIIREPLTRKQSSTRGTDDETSEAENGSNNDYRQF